MAKFEIYSLGGLYRWRLWSSSDITATAGESYVNKSDCRDGVRLTQQLAPTADIPPYQDDAGEWRWRLRANSHKIIAASSEGYASKSNCERAIQRFREVAPTAKGEE